MRNFMLDPWRRLSRYDRNLGILIYLMIAVYLVGSKIQHKSIPDPLDIFQFLLIAFMFMYVYPQALFFGSKVQRRFSKKRPVGKDSESALLEEINANRRNLGQRQYRSVREFMEEQGHDDV